MLKTFKRIRQENERLKKKNDLLKAEINLIKGANEAEKPTTDDVFKILYHQLYLLNQNSYFSTGEEIRLNSEMIVRVAAAIIPAIASEPMLVPEARK